MRILIIAALILATTIACAPRSEELLPIPASVKGASRIAEIEVAYDDRAVERIGAMDQRLSQRAGAKEVEPFARLLERSIREAAEGAGLTSGRALKLIVEIDTLQTADVLSAAVGRDDRLEGNVLIRDAATGEGLGQLYVDIDRANGGFISLLARIGNVRESLARQFGTEVARALGGKVR